MGITMLMVYKKHKFAKLLNPRQSDFASYNTIFDFDQLRDKYYDSCWGRRWY